MNFGLIQSEVRITQVRSRGPGGQNVNKVSSSAQLFWNYQDSQGLSEEEKKRIHSKLSHRISKLGLLIIRSDEYRDLERNKAACLDKLHRLILQALKVPKPRKATKPSKSAKEKRLKQKSSRGEIKRLRRSLD